MAHLVSISSIVLFLSRDCADATGPVVDAAAAVEVVVGAGAVEGLAGKLNGAEVVAGAGAAVVVAAVDEG